MSAVLIDFLGMTFKSVSDVEARDFALRLLRNWLGVDLVLKESTSGWNGYASRVDIEGVGLFAYGGAHQRDTIHFEITGTGCALVRDWESVALDLEAFKGKLTRIDYARDDYSGERFGLQWAKDQYHQHGGFKPARGAHPDAQLVSDEGSGKGSTFYVGSRQSGKLYRGYEKGKQTGTVQFPNWWRCEVEYRAVHRSLSADMIRRPADYFRGAYKCLDEDGGETCRPLTVAYTCKAAIDKAIDHARKQAGRLIHMLLDLNGGDIGEVFALLHRPELPPRLKALHQQALHVLRHIERKASPPSFWREASFSQKQTLSAALRIGHNRLVMARALRLTQRAPTLGVYAHA